MSDWQRTLERAQKAAIRFARTANETLVPSRRYVIACEIEGAIVAVATGPYAARLKKAIEQLEDAELPPFVVEVVPAEKIEQLAPKKRAA